MNRLLLGAFLLLLPMGWVRAQGERVWENIVSPTRHSLLDVAWGNGHWLALGSEMTEGKAILLHSSDGVRWIHRPVPPFVAGSRVGARLVHTGDRFFVFWRVLDERGEVTAKVYDSPDGSAWRETGLPQGEDGQEFEVADIVYAEGAWVAVGPEGLFARSTDLANWSVVDPPVLSRSLQRVVFLNGMFYAFASSSYGAVAFSSMDGLSWVELEKPLQMIGIADLETGLIGSPGVPPEPVVVITDNSARVLIGYPDGHSMRWDYRDRGDRYGPMANRVSRVDGQLRSEWVNVRSNRIQPAVAIYGLHDPTEASPQLEDTRTVTGFRSVASSPEAMVGVGMMGTIRRISLVAPASGRVPELAIIPAVDLRWSGGLGKLYQVEESVDGIQWQSVEPNLVPGTGAAVRRQVASNRLARQFRVTETGPLTQDRGTWEVIPSPTAANLGSVAWGNGHWLALGSAEGPVPGAATILHSTDGRNWSLQPPPPFPAGRLFFTGDRFFVINRTYPTLAGLSVMAVFDSVDGHTWRETPVPVDELGQTYGITDILYAEGRWVAVGLSGLFAWANELGQWHIDGYHMTDRELNRVVYLNGMFCAFGDDNLGGLVFVSPDGIEWEPQKRPPTSISLGQMSVGLFGPPGGVMEQAVVIAGGSGALIGRWDAGGMRWNVRQLASPRAGFVNRLSRLDGQLRSEWVSFGEASTDGTTSIYQLYPSMEVNVRRERVHSAATLEKMASGPDALIGVGANGAIRRYALPAQAPTPEPTLMLTPAVELRWSSQLGHAYRLETSENLIDWSPAEEEAIDGTGVELSRQFGIDRPARHFRVATE